MTDQKPQPEPIEPWSEEELDELSIITPEDIAAAEAQWRKDVPAAFRNLLDAQPEPEPEEDDQSDTV